MDMVCADRKRPFFAYVIVVGAASYILNAGNPVQGSIQAVLTWYGLLILYLEISVAVPYPSILSVTQAHHDHNVFIWHLCSCFLLITWAVVPGFNKDRLLIFCCGVLCAFGLLLVRFEGEGFRHCFGQIHVFAEPGPVFALGRTTGSFFNGWILKSRICALY